MTPGAPFISVVIRSRNEADRLRLTLASLERQAEDCEIIVVDDGSDDHTEEVLADAASRLPLRAVRHALAKGRSAASNAGAQEACGEVLLFHDGDTLFGPGSLGRHAALHEASDGVIGRGNTWHLRATRLLRDPERATPWPGQEEALVRRPPDEVDRMRVTRRQVIDDFAAIVRRAEPGVYPGAGPRRLHELEAEALNDCPDCAVLWSAACGSNQSVRRRDFLAVGGFDERLDINEHRELALKLAGRGHRLRPVSGAFSYHLTHRSGWRDPLVDTGWEAVFLEAHPIPAVPLLSVFWASLSAASPIPEPYRIASLTELERAARGDFGLDYDVARRCINARPLGEQFWAERARMSGPAVEIAFDVLATLPAEHPPFRAAAAQVSRWLGAASGTEHPVRLRLRASLKLDDVAAEGGAIVISLLNEVSNPASFAEIAMRWRRQAAALVAATARPVFLCTVFRHVPTTPQGGGDRAAVVERIRRLNLLAVELSHASGASVIDIDRTLAHFGAGPLRTDYLLAGAPGIEAAADTIAAGLLAAGLDDFIPAAQLQKAQQLHGGLDGLGRRLRQHMATS